MKKITKFLMAFLCLGLIFASCNKDNFDYEKAEREQIEKVRLEKVRRDSLKRIQAPLLEQYAKTKWGDKAKYSDSTGIWYMVELATGNETPYKYTGSISYYGPQLSAWSATLNFKGELMNGTVFDKNTDGVPKSYSNISTAIDTYGIAWIYAFVPTIINIQGKDERFDGLLPKGLQKNDKITFISPSYHTFDQTEYTKGSEKVTVPKNTPVVYTIELKSIGAVGAN
ncbi:hypothetical protein [Sphingobacterium faecium]|jgi:FKBP-type peptidyl-prolyl cis-trans isomerase FkpA|uniref:hypothetical protein n=1 Tax=Sphingobacterium faecium TaxID=34087 RepID=UPI0004E5FF2E|nr:hypothetical protein [Sphingobacterium faecium]CDT08251.1 conserved exported hypothetical protein [Sphingobacterium sp. PM2-P1-29]SJN51382.1 hypothetical protein FM120_30355 [Sphingobacterium faecium PCAi_F2.5]HCU43650.1 hypothetical protein [Sphingobacterium sp.]UXD69721.1 hypothetical protein MUK51_00175 [Sphingobacterium faecium]WGQ13269.1 hypothetical protein QG727_14665 [Sphingobacterium faecium]